MYLLRAEKKSCFSARTATFVCIIIILQAKLLRNRVRLPLQTQSFSFLHGVRTLSAIHIASKRMDVEELSAVQFTVVSYVLSKLRLPETHLKTGHVGPEGE